MVGWAAVVSSGERGRHPLPLSCAARRALDSSPSRRWVRLGIRQRQLIGDTLRHHQLMVAAMIGVMLKRELAIGALNAPPRCRHGQAQQRKCLLRGRGGRKGVACCRWRCSASAWAACARRRSPSSAHQRITLHCLESGVLSPRDQRKAEPEGGACPWSAFQTHLSAMPLDNRPADIEAQP